MERKKIVIQNSDGTTTDAQLITYLLSEDQQFYYVVYSKGEMSGDAGDEIIYVSRLARNGNDLYIEEIHDEIEWSNVQQLLKKIANA